VVAIGVTLMALGMFVGAELIERKMAGRTRSAAKPTEPASEQTQSA
jgi:hypothetical protein